MTVRIQGHDRVSLKDGAVSAEIDGEIVALDINTGICYGLDPIGSRIWQLIESSDTVSDICAKLETEYDVDAETCHEHVVDLLHALQAENLVVVGRA